MSRSRPIKVSVSDPKSNVSVSVSISGKMGRSRSRSRLELEVKRLGLVSVSDLNVSFTSLGNEDRCNMIIHRLLHQHAIFDKQSGSLKSGYRFVQTIHCLSNIPTKNYIKAVQ